MLCCKGGKLAQPCRSVFERSFSRYFGGVSVKTGQKVDRHLDASGAWAQAIDRSTILLSSRLDTLAPLAKMLVLGHELAHTVQLARNGWSAERFLEKEAWEAAIDALSGVAHEVRGTASRPLCAKGLFGPKDTTTQAAFEYYTKFNKEPVGTAKTIKIEKPELIDPINLDALLQKMLKNASEIKGKDLFIVSHGNKDGLVMQLFAKQTKKYYANTVSLNALMKYSAASIAKSSGFAQADIERLIKNMKAIQALQIKRLEFRGCTIGSSIPALKTLRQFFNADSVGALKAKSNFGWLTPNIRKYNAKLWNGWKKRFPKTAVIDVSPVGEYIAVSINPATNYTEMLTESHAATKWWISKRFPSETPPVYSGGKFPIHSLSTSPRVTFPLDAAYVKHLQWVSK